MSGARLYLSSDANAPVLTGNDNTCLVKLLKACLIDGYGSKQPVGGWTMPYSNAAGTAAVFRNDAENGGLGHYMRVGWTTGATWGHLCYENMTSVDDGVFPWMTAAITYTISASTNNVIRPWLLVATNTWVFFIVFNNAVGTDIPTDISTRYISRGFWFGDIERWNPSDNYHTMFARAGDNRFGLSSSSSSYSSYSSAQYLFPRDSLGDATPLYCSGYLPHPQVNARFGAYGPEYSSTSGLLVAKVAFGDKEPYSLRGWLPDALVPLHPRPFPQLGRVTINNTTYIAVIFHNAQSDVTPAHYSQILFALAEGE